MGAPKVPTRRSNVEHIFEMFASKDGKELMIDIVSGKRNIGYSEVLKFFVKTFDTQPGRSILVVMPGLISQGPRLGQLHGMEIACG